MRYPSGTLHYTVVSPAVTTNITKEHNASLFTAAEAQYDSTISFVDDAITSCQNTKPTTAQIIFTISQAYYHAVLDDTTRMSATHLGN